MSETPPLWGGTQKNKPHRSPGGSSMRACPLLSYDWSGRLPLGAAGRYFLVYSLRKGKASRALVTSWQMVGGTEALRCPPEAPGSRERSILCNVNVALFIGF